MPEDLIVVGVDGSSDSLAALRFALREASESGAAVRAVNAWHVPALAYGSPYGVPDFSSDLCQEAEAIVEQALAAVAEAVDGITVERAVREGDPGHVLVAEAEDAKQLVVGSHGHGPVGELVLGSVSHYCCRHAHCPVTVIPHGCPESD